MKKLEKIIAVKWYDACSITINQIELDSLNNYKAQREYLPIKITYGKVHKIYKDVVVIINEESSFGQYDITLIPRGWIISPIIKNKKRANKENSYNKK